MQVANRGVAQFGRALRSGRRGRGFESRRLDFCHLTKVIHPLRGYMTKGSTTHEKSASPMCRAQVIHRLRRYMTIAGIAQPVEHFTRNEGVVSSNLISSCSREGFQIEAWLSLVEHHVRDVGVACSSHVASIQTISKKRVRFSGLVFLLQIHKERAGFSTRTRARSDCISHRKMIR